MFLIYIYINFSTEINLNLRLLFIFSLFRQTSDAYSLLILVQLICSMMHIVGSIFGLDLVSDFNSFFVSVCSYNYFFKTRLSKIPTCICVSLLLVLLPVVRLCFVTALAENRLHKIFSTMLIVCSNRIIGMFYRLIFKNSTFWWCKVHKSLCIIMDLVWLIWVWLHLLRYSKLFSATTWCSSK